MRYRPNAGEIVLRIVCNERIRKFSINVLLSTRCNQFLIESSPASLIQAEINAISRAECVTGQMQAKLCLESSAMNEAGNFLSTPYYLHVAISFLFKITRQPQNTPR